jgi:hypothetical protein
MLSISDGSLDTGDVVIFVGDKEGTNILDLQKKQQLKTAPFSPHSLP